MPYSGEPGVNHLAYEVDDVESLRATLKAAGFRESTVPNAHPHRKRVYFYDPDGAFSWELDASPNFHARSITTDTGWKITIDPAS